MPLSFSFLFLNRNYECHECLSITISSASIPAAASESHSFVVHSTASSTSKRDVCFLVDLGECGVERLWDAVVEGTGLTIVLSRDHDKVLNLALLHVAHILSLELVQADTW